MLKRSRSSFLFGLILVIIMTNQAWSVPDLHLNKDRVHVYFAQRDEKIAQISLNVVHKQQQRLTERYHLDVHPVHIYIADNQETYRKYSGKSSPVWSAGLASDDKMLVKSPSYSRQSILDFQKTLLHETAHLAVNGIPLPTWFNEGFAQYEAGQFDLNKKILVSQTYWSKHFMQSKQIENLMQMNRDQAQIAYAQSVAMYDYLVNYFSLPLVGKCLNYAKEYQNFDKAFLSAFLMNTIHFEKIWQKNASKQYRFYVILSQNNLIWSLAPILLILGFILTKKRRKKLMDSWESSADDMDEIDA